MEFGRCINRQWKGSTYAPSESKARCNLMYQYKKQFRKATDAKINLPGKITITG